MSDKIQIPEPPLDPESPLLETSTAVAELPEEGEGAQEALELEVEVALDPEATLAEPAELRETEETEESEPGPGEELDEEELVRSVTALVFASPEPLGVSRLVSLLDGPRPARIKNTLAEVNRRLEAAGLPLELREIAGGWRLMTRPEMSEAVASLVKARKAETLSPAGLETLAVVAYRQPVTKAEIEAIRGVQCGSMLRNLTDRGLTRVTGRADLPGHPLQYGTTRGFLDRFGLGSLKDLPRDGELLQE